MEPGENHGRLTVKVLHSLQLGLSRIARYAFVDDVEDIYIYT